MVPLARSLFCWGDRLVVNGGTLCPMVSLRESTIDWEAEGDPTMQSSAQVEQVVVATLRQLSPEQQQEVLDFTEFLRQKQPKSLPRRSRLKGACADLKLHITEEAIATARQEMWGNFPRRFPNNGDRH